MVLRCHQLTTNKNLMSPTSMKYINIQKTKSKHKEEQDVGLLVLLGGALPREDFPPR